MFLYDERYSSLERVLAGRKLSIGSELLPILPPRMFTANRDKLKFMFGIWRCENEVTLLLEEDDVDRFPEGSLIVSPQPWKVIKLSGRPIDYDETGVVCAMSQVESDVPTLNISTAITNCTLVPEERLEYTLDHLSKGLQCPVTR